MKEVSISNLVFTVIFLFVCGSVGILEASEAKPAHEPENGTGVQASEVKQDHQSEDEAGFYGSIVVGGGFSQSRSNLLEADDDNKKIKSLKDTAKKESDPMPFFNVEAGYMFTSGTWVSLNYGGDMGVSVGQSLGDLGSLSMDVSYSKTEVWKDPYLVGVNREETDATGLAVGLSYEEMLGLPVSLSLGYEQIDVDDDAVGKKTPKLSRDGRIYSAGLTFPLFQGDRSLVSGGISYARGDMDGKSNSYHGYAFTLGHEIELGNGTLSSSVQYGRRKYDAVHPVFGKKREDTDCSFNAEYVYDNPFGYENTFVGVVGSISNTDSDMKFFESSERSVGVKVGYNF